MLLLKLFSKGDTQSCVNNKEIEIRDWKSLRHFTKVFAAEPPTLRLYDVSGTQSCHTQLVRKGEVDVEIEMRNWLWDGERRKKLCRNSDWKIFRDFLTSDCNRHIKAILQTIKAHCVWYQWLSTCSYRSTVSYDIRFFYYQKQYENNS